MNNFSPELRIFNSHDQSQIVVTFDSMSEIDRKRSACCIQIPANFRQLSFSIEGFDTVNDISDRRIASGKINLVTTDDSGVKTTHELADCEFMFSPIGKPKNGVLQFPPVEQVEYHVRQGVSDALVLALTGFYSVCRSTAESLPSPIVYSAGKPIDASNEPKIFRRKMALAILGAPLLVWFLAWGGSKFINPSSPIEEAVARAMAQDPAAVASQVELTRQTLQQMGLDPGQSSGDLGCLAPQ